MSEATAAADGVNRRRLFAGICLALVPTGAQFVLIANVLGQLKGDFLLSNAQVGWIAGLGIGAMAISLLVLGPWLEKYGMRAGTAMAVVGHLGGLTIMLSAATMIGDPSAFWLLLCGAALMAVGNGMIEVAGNPLTTALYPDDKTAKLNLFHAFFPLGIVSGALIGFGLNFLEGTAFHWMYHWTFQLGIIYVPMILYAVMVLPQRFPRTEYGEAGLPFGDMFRVAFRSPLLYLMLLMLGGAMYVELGAQRFIPEIFRQAGIGAYILLIAWSSALMLVLRLFAGHFVRWLTPPGMLFFASLITAVALWTFSGADGYVTAFLGATLFGVGIAFFFPTIVGIVAERAPRTGSFGLVLTMAFGFAVGGFVGAPTFGALLDNQVAKNLDEEHRAATTSVLFQEDGGEGSAEVLLARARDDIDGMGPEDLDERGIEFVAADLERALAAIGEAWSEYEEHGREIRGTAVPTALRQTAEIVAPEDEVPDVTAIGGVVEEAGALLAPAEAWGGQRSLLLISPIMLAMLLVFGAMYLHDRRRGGYRAERLSPVQPEEVVRE